MRKRKKGEEEDWKVALRKLRENHLPTEAPRNHGQESEEELSSSSSDVDESVSCTSDSFCPKYATQKRRSAS